MDTFEARRLFLKLGGFALAAAAGLKGSIHSQAYERGYLTNADAEDYGRAYDLGYGNPVVEEFIPEKPFVYDEKLFEDQFGILTDWEERILEPTYFTFHEVNPDSKDPWYKMRLKKLKPRAEIADVMKHTMPLYLPHIEDDQDIMNLAEESDPLERIEQVLTILGIETREQYQPEVILENYDVDPQIYYSGTKLIHFAKLRGRAMALLSAYGEYLKLNPNLSVDETSKIYAHREYLFSKVIEIREYLDGYANEFSQRVCNPYFYFDKKMWPGHRYAESFEYLSIGSCYRMASLLIHTLSILSGSPQESPIIAQADGLIALKDVGDLPNGNSRWNMDNFVLWLNTEATKHGWDDVTGHTYEQYVQMTGNGDYLIAVNMEDEALTKPQHLFVLWQNMFFCFWQLQYLSDNVV